MSTKLLFYLVGLLLSLGLGRAILGWETVGPVLTYAPTGPYKSTPRGCSIEQVNLVSGGSFVFVCSTDPFASFRFSVMELDIQALAPGRSTSLPWPS